MQDARFCSKMPKISRDDTNKKKPLTFGLSTICMQSHLRHVKRPTLDRIDSGESRLTVSHLIVTIAIKIALFPLSGHPLLTTQPFLFPPPKTQLPRS